VPWLAAVVAGPTVASQAKIPIGISSCLLGEKVRYDGTDKYAAELLQSLGEQFEFIGFCPEVDIGLGIPRETIQLVKAGDRIRCIGSQTATLDVTDRLRDCADQHHHWHSKICGYIFKQRSPSCGIGQVDVFSVAAGKFSLNHQRGTGIYAQQLMNNFPVLPIADEEQLAAPGQRETFIQQVLTYWRRQNHAPA